MIELNFLPEDQRLKKPKLSFEISRRQILFVAATVVTVLIVAHFILFGIALLNGYGYKRLMAEWNLIKPEKEKVDSLKGAISTFDVKSKSIEGVTSGGRILWSQKLNRISDLVPRGIWLRWIAFQNDHLTIEGSSVSRSNEEIIFVNRFSAALKNDSDFCSSCVSSELASIKRRKIKKIEIVDFTIDTYFR
ncbi:PilN domain-containing protein [Candidatus Omnitrophota bacterium]